MAGGQALLIEIEAFIPPRASIAAGHSLVDVGYGRLEAGGWYLVRRANGHSAAAACVTRQQSSLGAGDPGFVVWAVGGLGLLRRL